MPDSPVCRATQGQQLAAGGQSGELLIWAKPEQHCMGKINQVAIIFVNLEEQSDRSSTETILG